jgi:hypothetical protein
MTVINFDRTLSKTKVAQIISNSLILVEQIDNSVANLKGFDLLQTLKRKPVGAGPYPMVALFEAANRIMSDLVILYGVQWLLENDVFPFDTYSIEYGTEDQSGFDIRASGGGKKLVGEAFNVAPSFFQSKKTSVLKKLRQPDVSADYKIIMFNHDAVETSYTPKLRKNEFFVFVQVLGDRSWILPSLSSRSMVSELTSTG